MTLPASLAAQQPAAWSLTSPSQLPAAGNVQQIEHLIRPPRRGVDSLTVHADVRLTGGTAYVYVYGRTPRNKFLGYRSSARVEATGDTTVTLTVHGVATTEMDSLIIGVYHYGEGTATVAPPRLTRGAVLATTPPPVIAAYLDEFFAIARARALDRELLDWEMLRTDANALAAGVDSVADVHGILDFTLRRIDHHSYLQPPGEHEGWANGHNDNDEIDPNLRYASGRRVDDRMVYLSMPGVSSGHDRTLRAYADSLTRLIAQLDAPGTDEWVLDLRGNEGGNCWAMLAGIGPLLGDGECGYFMQRDGSAATAWWVWEGASWLGRQKQLTLAAPYALRQPARIAVLYGPKTSSSGEVVAIAFRGLPNSRSFGQPTGGYSTGNRIFRLSDGAAAVLTVSVYGDRKRVAYGNEVLPDETVAPARGIDAASEAAATWLRNDRR